MSGVTSRSLHRPHTSCTGDTLSFHLKIRHLHTLGSSDSTYFGLSDFSLAYHQMKFKNFSLPQIYIFFVFKWEYLNLKNFLVAGVIYIAQCCQQCCALANTCGLRFTFFKIDVFFFIFRFIFTVTYE